MTDKHVDAYELYISAWSAISDEERLRRLRASVVQAIIFRNATQTRNGLSRRHRAPERVSKAESGRFVSSDVNARI